MKSFLVVPPSALALFLVVGWGSLNTNDSLHGERIEARPEYGDPPAAWVGPDQRTVVIRSLGGACDDYVQVKVRERPDTVKIAITVRVSPGPCMAVGLRRGYKVVLRKPLGNRKLVAIDDVAYPRTGEPIEESSRTLHGNVPVVTEFE